MNLPFLLFLCILSTTSAIPGYDKYKKTCGVFGKLKTDYCESWHGVKTGWISTMIAFFPNDYSNYTYTELTKHCTDQFECFNNTGCYRDFVNYAKLDKCMHNAYMASPFHSCETKFRELSKKHPENLRACVLQLMRTWDPEEVDCKSIYETGKCYMDDIERHCDARTLEMHKLHLSTRLYNRGCDGRLIYQDGGDTLALDPIPGGFKVSDAKRDYLLNMNITEV